MRRIVVLALLIVLSFGVFASLYADSVSRSLTRSSVETYSSSYPSNFIDHLPFVITEPGVYYVVKDLTVNGDGITILANNTVLIGYGHTITGNGTGNGIYIKDAYHNTVTDFDISNFYNGIFLLDTKSQRGKGPSGNVIEYNIVHDNKGIGIAIWNDQAGGPLYNYIINNIVVNNYLGWGGIVLVDSYYNFIYNNFLSNNSRNGYDDGLYNDWNTTYISGYENILGGDTMGGNFWSTYNGLDDGSGFYPHNITGDGIGDTEIDFRDGGHINGKGDFLPLVDIISPCYGLTSFNSALADVVLNVTWEDNVQISKSILEFDGVNYTDAIEVDESLDFNEYYQVEHKITYSKSFSNLSLGTHYYRWYANDTKNQWNSTQLLSFNVTAIPQINTVEISPILEVTANVTCEGFTNITEIIDYTKLHFKIDDNWDTMNMTYNPQTTLYHALTPAYTELANKTIQYYITAMDTNNNTITSDTITHQVPEWVMADLNRDGKVDYKDLFIFARNYGKPE